VDGNRLDPDPNFHFYADPDLDPDRIKTIPVPVHMRMALVGKSEILFYFFSQHCQFAVYYLSHQGQSCHNFQYFGQHLEIFWKKVLFINSIICLEPIRVR
jgi:hypothetical protein